MKRILAIILIGIALGVSIAVALNTAWVRSSRDENCMVCHVHPHAEDSWRLSSHYNNASGTKVSCADCHLPPPGGIGYVHAKIKTGGKDIWSYLFKNKNKIDWEAKGDLDYARTIVYNESCLACHHQLLPEGISDDGVVAHLYYEENAEKLALNCIDCHLDVGHFDPNYTHARMTGVPEQKSGAIFTDTVRVVAFENFTEKLPGTAVSFEMKAVEGGTFTMGSPADEPFRGDNETQSEQRVERFFMAETEVGWDLYWAFFAETMSEGRLDPAEVMARNADPDPDIDAISGPTPPFGNPEQGWGGGARPAITMTHYAAETFCRWLSQKTGRTYRLPTEAEWEYAARGGTDGAYFFGGSPRKYSSRGVWRKIFGADTTTINTYVTYDLNSRNRTREPSSVKANPWGLKNMLGSVWEYTSDGDGEEWMIRGGGYEDDAADVRVAIRAQTQHEMWLRTDPQQPKSIWWYSDMKAIGFRVVMDYDN